MIVKGKPRSGGAQLAAYLMRVDDGERPSLIELMDGGQDIHKALVQWEAIGEGTRGEKPLYHAQIAPEAKYSMSSDQWRAAAQILAEELGMKNHPRLIVVHDGGDKPHAHVVFQRTDADTMTMWATNKNYEKHERASKRMELEFGHEMVPGKHAKRDRKKQPEFPRSELTQAEAQQEKRTGLKVADRKAEIAALHAASDTGPAFKAALEDAGYILAKGDRGYVVVDQAGGHSVLSRNIKGLKQKDTDAFMTGVELDTLPTVDEAKALQQDRPVKAEKLAQEASQFLPPHPPQKAEPPAPAPQDPELEAVKKALAERQAKEVGKRADLHTAELRQRDHELGVLNAGKAEDFDAIQTQEREALKDAHKQERSGIKGFLKAIQSKLNPAAAAEKAKERHRQADQLKRRQDRERKDYLALIEQTRQQEIENLKERQAMQRIDVERKHGEESDRYIREHQEAKRILAELEAQRIHEELEHNDSLRDGPPPPKLGK